MKKKQEFSVKIIHKRTEKTKNNESDEYFKLLCSLLNVSEDDKDYFNNCFLNLSKSFEKNKAVSSGMMSFLFKK